MVQFIPVMENTDNIQFVASHIVIIYKAEVWSTQWESKLLTMVY